MIGRLFHSVMSWPKRAKARLARLAYRRRWEIGTVVAFLVIGGLVYVPKMQVDGLWFESAVEKSKLEGEHRRTLLQLAAGLFVIVGLYFGWKRIEIANETRLTDLFVRANEQLGSGNLEIRLGGIYALEQVSKDSEKYRWTVIEILTAYAREWSKRERAETKAREEKPNDAQDTDKDETVQSEDEERSRNTAAGTDILAIATILRRREGEIDTEPDGLDLSGVDFRKADLRKADLREANLRGANLREANLFGADLFGADLRNANLQKADLQEANLREAKLREAKLREANFHDADLSDANLGNADLGGAILSHTNQLTATQLLAAENPEAAILDEKLKRELDKALKEREKSK